MSGEFLSELERLSAVATDAPWVHGADDDPPSEDIHAESGGAIAMVWPHANVRTVMRHGENFSHADARLIVAMRNALPELVRLARLGLEAERRTIDLTGEAMRDCIEYLHKNDGFRSLRVRVFDGEIKLEILTAPKGLEPIAEARGALFHDAVATLKDEW